MKLLRQLFCATIVSFVSAPMRHLLGLVILSSPVLASSQTTTPNLALNIPGSDSPDWNVLLNKNFLKLDSYLTGSATLHGVLYPASCGTSYAPSWCYGADIGAWINAAYAQLGPNGGSIYVAAGTFPWSTPLNFFKPRGLPSFYGRGRNATTLRWVGETNATAITFNCGSFSPGGGILPGFGLRDIHFTKQRFGWIDNRIVARWREWCLWLVWSGHNRRRIRYQYAVCRQHLGHHLCSLQLRFSRHLQPYIFHLSRTLVNQFSLSIPISSIPYPPDTKPPACITAKAIF